MQIDFGRHVTSSFRYNDPAPRQVGPSLIYHFAPVSFWRVTLFVDLAGGVKSPASRANLSAFKRAVLTSTVRLAAMYSIIARLSSESLRSFFLNFNSAASRSL